MPTLTDEKVWEQFLEWLPSAESSTDPGHLFGQYRSRLRALGLMDGEVDVYLAIVANNMRTRSDGWRVMFNNIYASGSAGFSTAPNALLMATVEEREPGRALEVGMGEGRNAVFLALKGWDVTGFEISDEGVVIAQRNARAVGVNITALLESNESFDFGRAQWDLIVATYAPFPLTTADYVQRLRGSLTPGGLVVVESFASDANAPSRRPVDIDPTDLRRAFDSFRILYFEDTVALPDWTREKTCLVRLVAEYRA
jgi:SAM-dependent methyltransferase